jgi:hypothetical protein
MRLALLALAVAGIGMSAVPDREQAASFGSGGGWGDCEHHVNVALLEGVRPDWVTVRWESVPDNGRFEDVRAAMDHLLAGGAPYPVAVDDGYGSRLHEAMSQAYAAEADEAPADAAPIGTVHYQGRDFAFGHFGMCDDDVASVAVVAS